MSRNVFEPGDRVQWPQTQLPAAESSERFLTVEQSDWTRYRNSGKYYVRYLYMELLDILIWDMQEKVMDHFDNLVVIIGDEGTGKSNLAYHVCTKYDPDFDMRKSLSWTWDKFLDQLLAESGDKKVYWLDEAVNVAGGREWMKEANKMLIRILQTQRSVERTLVMCIPVFRNIDVYIRTHRCSHLLVAQRMRWEGDREKVRGYFEMKVPPENRKEPEPDEDPVDWFVSKGFGRFSAMPPEASKIYEEMKGESQVDSLIEMKERTEEMRSGSSRYKKDKQRLENLISYLTDEQGMSYMDVADIAGMPYDTVKGMAWRQRNKKGEYEE